MFCEFLVKSLLLPAELRDEISLPFNPKISTGNYPAALTSMFALLIPKVKSLTSTDALAYNPSVRSNEA